MFGVVLCAHDFGSIIFYSGFIYSGLESVTWSGNWMAILHPSSDQNTPVVHRGVYTTCPESENNLANWNGKSEKISFRWTYQLTCSTLPETNIAPENEPLEKEIPIGNHLLSWFQGGYIIFKFFLVLPMDFTQTYIIPRVKLTSLAAWGPSSFTNVSTKPCIDA